MLSGVTRRHIGLRIRKPPVVSSILTAGSSVAGNINTISPDAMREQAKGWPDGLEHLKTILRLLFWHSNHDKNDGQQ